MAKVRTIEAIRFRLCARRAQCSVGRVEEREKGEGCWRQCRACVAKYKCCLAVLLLSRRPSTDKHTIARRCHNVIHITIQRTYSRLLQVVQEPKIQLNSGNPRGWTHFRVCTPRYCRQLPLLNRLCLMIAHPQITWDVVNRGSNHLPREGLVWTQFACPCNEKLNLGRSPNNFRCAIAEVIPPLV